MIKNILRSLSELFYVLSWISFRPKHWFSQRFGNCKDTRHLYGLADAEGVSHCKICFKPNKEVL